MTKKVAAFAFISILLSSMLFLLSGCRNPASSPASPHYVIVSFYTASGTPTIEYQIIPLGGMLEPVDPPQRAGFRFAGWYSDSYHTYRWDFDNSIVTENITLFARWIRAGGGGGGGMGGGGAGPGAPAVPPATTVTGVTVTPPSIINVPRGQTQQFSAIVAGTNNPPQTVTWTVTGGIIGTNINESGLLTVAAGEEIADRLTVIATSTADTTISGTAVVQITDPVEINLVRITPGVVHPPTGPIFIDTAFYIGRFQITQAQWEEVMTGNNNGINPTPSHFRAGGGGATAVAGMDTSNFPVENVSWFDALVFSNRVSLRNGLTPAYEMQAEGGGQWTTNPDLWGTAPTSSNARWNNVWIVHGSTGYRLPTSDQWEFAGRAGTTTDFHNGVNFDWNSAVLNPLVAPIAWFWFNSGNRTHEAGTRAPNAWGIHDMHGNVREWCWDEDWGGNRVLRGGSWVEMAAEARFSLRPKSNIWPHSRSNLVGFRVVRP